MLTIQHWQLKCIYLFLVNFSVFYVFKKKVRCKWTDAIFFFITMYLRFANFTCGSILDFVLSGTNIEYTYEMCPKLKIPEILRFLFPEFCIMEKAWNNNTDSPLSYIIISGMHIPIQTHNIIIEGVDTYMLKNRKRNFVFKTLRESERILLALFCYCREAIRLFLLSLFQNIY